MTGEMHKSEVTIEAYPLHFAVADLFDGATVEPFDQYQGPYIYLPGKGRFWLSSDDGVIGEWYDERRDRVSVSFLGPNCMGMDIDSAIVAFQDLIENGGMPIEREND